MGAPPSHATTTPDRQFWRAVLATGGLTDLPRPPAGPDAGPPRSGAHDRALSPATVLAARRAAADLGVPPAALLVAACARVHAALTGEPHGAIGVLLDPATGALPCRLPVPGGTWAELVAAAHRYLTGVAEHGARSLPLAAAERGAAGPLFDVLLDLGDARPAGDTPESPALLRLRVEPDGAEARLTVRFRADVLDAGQAERVAGYVATALGQLADDPGATYRDLSLLSPAEVRHQLDGLAGPARKRPDRRLHELFEDRVRRHPEAIAATLGEQSWTYAELNRRANRVAHALRAAGSRGEDVVAVVSERGLDWLAAVLGVFKAGGTYLPVEPHFPADRVAAMLRRSDCRFALAGPDTGHLLAGQAGLRTLELGPTTTDERHVAEDPGWAVAAGDLAYIYFTSGSTGEPKGAMCEHAGMLNHVLAKIEDLGIGPGDVVAQTAPQCFDISLWQLVAALLVGGRTLIVEQEAVLDVDRFVARVDAGGVTVLQLVPSYLDVVLTALDGRPDVWPGLRCVSVTGEAVKAELARRWFAARPGTVLVNAYGLTETSDDTNHEVMDRAPDGDSVPLGAPIANVRVYVVDERLRLVPLGSSGEIVFSGVCVGRGYVNDPDRTARAFLIDPYRPGERLYRSGDFGRWRPDGKLEFHGRRDAQVKIRGFRIEIGEIEGRLVEVTGGRDAAVVVTGEADAAQLVAFFTGAAGSVDEVRTALAATLPEYMVPAALHQRPALPLTGNGKIDRKALTQLALELAGHRPATTAQAPHTPSERRLAGAWADVLRVPIEQIGRTDHFFDRGGTSLSAVRLAMRLDRALTPQEVTRHPVLADLAAVLDAATTSPREPAHP